MRFLARAFRATNEPRYQLAFLKGLDHILEAQHPNGGWPQFYPPGKRYHRHITFNDGSMIRILELLRDVSESSDNALLDMERHAKVEAAVTQGIDCILRTQIKQDGKLTAWCAQHDEKTLEPAWARSYEPPSLSGAESVGIVRFLMSVEEPTPEIIAAAEGAIEWFWNVAIHGMRMEEFTDSEGRKDRRIVADPDAGSLWARFYEIGSNRPIFLNRDSTVYYSLTEIDQERRAGYRYYGGWAGKLLARDYPQWQSKHKHPKE